MVKRILLSVLLVSLLIGCSKKAEVKKETKILTEATNYKEAASIFRRHFKNREKSFEVIYKTKNKYDKNGEKTVVEVIYDLDAQIQHRVFDHTKVGDEGDSIKYNFLGYDIDGSLKDTKEYSIYTIKYSNLSYYSNKKQEDKLNKEIKKVLKKLDIEDKSEYQKVKIIYDYITKNVKYDNDHLDDPSYLLQYTAYNALIKKKAVCQGYALLLYRMLLEAGIDNRVIFGMNTPTNKYVTIYNTAEDDEYYISANHSWNIVKIGKYYYNVDATWDAVNKNRKCFLKSNKNFKNHIRAEEYEVEGFNKKYKMSSKDYKR